MKFPYSMKRIQNVKVQTTHVRTVHSGTDYCLELMFVGLLMYINYLERKERDV